MRKNRRRREVVKKRMMDGNWLWYALAAMLLFSAANVVLKALSGRQAAAGNSFLGPEIVAVAAGLALVGLAIAFLAGFLKISQNELLSIAVFIILAATGFALLLKSLATGKVAVVTGILALSTAAVAVLSYLFLGDRFSGRELLAMGLAVASVIVMVA